MKYLELIIHWMVVGQLRQVVNLLFVTILLITISACQSNINDLSKENYKMAEEQVISGVRNSMYIANVRISERYYDKSSNIYHITLKARNGELIRAEVNMKEKDEYGRYTFIDIYDSEGHLRY